MDAETLQLFDDYSGGRLEGEALKSFRSRLESDPEFSKEYDEYVLLISGINEFERERLKEIMKDNKSRLFYNRTSRKAFIRMAAAAAIIILLLIPAYFVYRSYTFPDRIATEFYIPDPGLPVTMGNATDPVMAQAMIEYKDGKYEKSLTLLNQLIAKQSDDDTLNYYAGICCYETDDNCKAIEHFQKVSSTESPYYFPAKYNLGLCFIKEGEIDNAKATLKEVVSGDDATLKEKAEQLLEKI